MKNKLKKLIFHPVAKSTFSVFSVIMSGVLCSALVTEITGADGKIYWDEYTGKTSFNWIVGFVIMSIAYNVFSAKEELNYRATINHKFLDKFLTEKGLAALADQVTDAIKCGDNNKLYTALNMKEIITKSLETK